MSDDATSTEDQQQSTGGDRTFSADQVESIVKERLAKERAKFGDVNELRRKAKAYDELEESNKSELEKLTARAAELEKKAAEAEIGRLRVEIAAEKGLTPAQARRLQGSTKEELASDADEILEQFGLNKDAGKKPAGDDQRPKERLTPVQLDNGSGGEVEKTDMNEWMRSKAASE